MKLLTGPVVTLFVVAMVSACGARAWACDSNRPEIHRNGQVVWCADPSMWPSHQADIEPFFEFADRLLPQIEKDFGVSSSETFYIVVDPANGGASTPTPYGPGVNVSGDAFYNVAYNVKGFYGYLLVVHEFVNQWTGLAISGGGWPTDWWANHRSPFPNAMDPILLAELGQNAAAKAQLARFVPGGDSADVQVPMFSNIFSQCGGWPMLQTFFATLKADGMQWGNLRDPPDFNNQTMFVSGNPSPLLANFVVAYMNLAAAADLQKRFDAAGIGTKPPNWPSGTAFTSYSLDANVIAQIGAAHCRLAAAESSTAATAAAAALRKGDYATVLRRLPAAATCPSTCTGLCACDAPTGTCLPRYMAKLATTDTGASPSTGGSVAPADPSPEAPTDGTGPDAAEEPQASAAMNAGCACSSQPVAGMVWSLVGLAVIYRLRRRARGL
jgi:MYXO-CTERM domain-containing protein